MNTIPLVLSETDDVDVDVDVDLTALVGERDLGSAFILILACYRRYIFSLAATSGRRDTSCLILWMVMAFNPRL